MSSRSDSTPAKPHQKRPAPMGGMVMWAPDPTGPWCPAVVTTAGHGTVDCSLVPPDSRNLIPKEGARFREDREFYELMDKTGGVWDYTDADKLLIRLSAELLGGPPDAASQSA